MDDLDDVLNDLLAEDPAPKRKQQTPTSGPGRRGKKGPTVHDDDFYKSLAANAGDSMSDVSDADPTQVVQGLDDLDDMDAALFGPKKSGPPKTPPAAASASKRANPTAPPSPSKSAGTPPAKSSPAKKSTFDFDDYDDPLADLLSDDEAKKPKRSAVKAKAEAAKTEIKTEDYRPSTGPPSAGEDSSSESRRLEINRPPTRSGNKPAAKKKEESMFDDEDVLGGLGFDDSPRGKPEPRRAAAASADEDRGKGRSIMDDLLGAGSASKHLEPPGSGGAGRSREFVLDKKYQKQEAKTKEFSEDDFNFGGYMPSAVTTPGSRPSSKRSVRFEDDDEDMPVGRGGSAGSRRGGGAAGLLEDMITKDDRDWLEIASNEPTTGKEDRPRSEGSIRSREPEKPSTAQSAASEPVDWLGLSRLGSPKLTSKDMDDDDKEIEPPRPRSGGRGGIPKELPQQDDDWLGSSPSKGRSEKKPTPSTSDKADDWLGTSSGKADDWLGTSSGKADDWLGTSSGKADDWLGASSSGKDADWLGVKDEPAAKDSEADDWLGLPKGPEKSKKDSAASGDYLALDDPFKTGPKARADERGLDLFSPPPTKDTSGSFPWDSESPGSRRRGRSRTPQKATRPQSPRGSSPNKPASPRGPSPADSPRDLMATLDALKKMDQKKPAAGPVKATPISTGPAPDPAPSVPASTSWSPDTGTTSVGGTDMQAGIMSSMFASPSMQSSQLEDMRRQEEMFAKQQRMMMEQQQKQQMEQQRVMAEQQERRRKQMQEAMEAQQRMMQQQMQQQQMSLSQPMQMPMMGMGFGSSMVGDELMGQVKRLEMEKMHLMTLLDTTRQQHQEELKLMEDSHKKRTEMMEESWNRREQRLKEENQFVVEQGQKKQHLLEQEKVDMTESHLRRQEALDRDHRAEVERLREQQRSDIDNMRKENEESLERLRRTKQLEVEAVANQHSTTQNMREVLSQISENTRGLNELQTQVSVKHNLSMDERETAARNRDESLKGLQERLERQHHDNETERARLQGLLSKMEAQLVEQARSMEEEKWRVRQEEGRLQAAQDALEKEKTIVMAQMQREREAIQKSKDQLLEEQKTVLAQLYEERRHLAQERAAHDMDAKLNTEKMQRENIKNVKTGAELEGSVRVINDEKARLAQQLDVLRAERERLTKDRAEMEQQQQSLAVEKEKLETIALQVRQRSKDIEDMCLMAAQAREAGETSLTEARRLEGDQAQRLNAIQAQLQTLRTKERQIAQERLSLAKEKQSIEASAKSLMCVSCRTPVRDTPGPGMLISNVTQNVQATTPLASRKMTPAAASLFSSLDPDLRAKVDTLDSVSAEIQMDRSIRLWRIAAKKDEDFLTEESMFLQAIRHTPYSETGS